jgi:CitMHS family citrate-Mg2+:H+ or citrate-Ca2+:H+ symporter
MLMKKYTAPFVAIAVVPCLACILIGQGAQLSAHIVKGIGSIGTTGIMFIFSVTFFGIMSDTGAFDPFITAIIKFTKGDPVRIMLGTCLFAFIGHLDGSGVTTVLLVVPPMLPIFDRLHMRRTSLAMALGLVAGIMNAVPWGGPTLRAATVLNMDVMELWRPWIPTQVFGLLCAFALCWWIGKSEKKRLIAEGILLEGGGFNFEEFAPVLTPEQKALRRPKLLLVNWLLIVGVLGLMVASIIAPVTAFLLGVALALIINYRDPDLQRKMIDEHGKDAILLSSVIFAAGVLMGVMGQTGMSKAMAETLVSLIPTSMSGFIAPIIGFFTIPLSLMFDADSYYYAIMPVIIKTVEAFGISGVDVARASMVGVMTLGWPTSPMVGTFFLFTGMIGLDIGEWQKYCLKYFIAISALMTLFMCFTGMFTFSV